MAAAISAIRLRPPLPHAVPEPQEARSPKQSPQSILSPCFPAASSPQKLSIPAWARQARDFLPPREPRHASAVFLAAGVLCVGLGIYYYLNSQGIRPQNPERIEPLPLLAP